MAEGQGSGAKNENYRGASEFVSAGVFRWTIVAGINAKASNLVFGLRLCIVMNAKDFRGAHIDFLFGSYTNLPNDCGSAYERVLLYTFGEKKPGEAFRTPLLHAPFSYLSTLVPILQLATAPC